MRVLKSLSNGKKIVSVNGRYAHMYPSSGEDETAAYYRSDAFYTSHSPSDWFLKEANEHRFKLWDAYFSYLMRVTRPKIPKPLTVVNVGCGSGILDHYWANRSQDTIHGIEPSESAREWYRTHSNPDNLGSFKRGVAIVYDSLEWFDQVVSVSPDIIILSLVLEHIPRPEKFFKGLVDRLKVGGRILVIVPNDFNPLQKQLDYEGFISDVHQNYFTSQTLRKFMTDMDLWIIHESATFPFELFAKAGIKYFGNDRLGRLCHYTRLGWERLLGWRVFRLYEKMYKKWGIGRELIFVGEKVRTVTVESKPEFVHIPVAD